jgi:ribose-phosphate pyrophosphokinase
MRLYSLDGESTLALALSAALEEPLAVLEDRRFEDGEHKWRPVADPRGQDACLIAPLHGDAEASPHDRLVRLLSLCATLRAHGAARVTTVLPYLAYARKDQRTQPFDPVGPALVARLLEAAGADQAVVYEAHNPAATENAFRLPLVSVDAGVVFERWAAQRAGSEPLVVASPDPGGVKRVLRWRERLEERLQRPVGFALVDKRRSLGVLAGGHLVAGDVAGATVLLRDDLVATGHTLAQAASALRHAGATAVHACAAHGLFTGDADRVLAASALESFAVSDGVPPWRLPPSCAAAARMTVVSAAPVLADVLRDLRDAWRR